jgi:hypothetical protein
MGTAVSALVAVVPDLYGSPVDGGVFTGAQDYPGLNAGYVGVLPVLLLGLGAIVGLGGGFVRFCGLGAGVLWGAAFGLPGAEDLVRLVPGLEQVAPTRLLGPAGFLAACGGAMVLDQLTTRVMKPGIPRSVGRTAITVVLILIGSVLVLKAPVDPHGGRPIVAGLISPEPDALFDGGEPVAVTLHLDQPVDDLRVSVDGRLLRQGRASATTAEAPLLVWYDAPRAEGGRHRLHVEAVRRGQAMVIADQPLAIRRQRRLTARDAAVLALSLGALALVVRSRRRAVPWVVLALVSGDVLSLANGYNVASPRAELFPLTRTVEFLRSQPPPFRVFTHGTILPPDTNVAVGVDHLLSYDNLGFHRTYQWLLSVPIDMDDFASFSFSRDSVDYASPRFDALDVRYVLTDLETDLGDVPGFRLVHESEARVWENTENNGRAWIASRAMNLRQDPVEALQAADPREVALLEETWPEPLGGRGTARVIEHFGGLVRVTTSTDGPAMLVLAENRGPGWTASVDGERPVPTLACDVAWQAVPVPAGEHSVEFRLDSPAWRWGARLSLCGALIALWMLVWPRRRAQLS